MQHPDLQQESLQEQLLDMTALSSAQSILEASSGRSPDFESGNFELEELLSDLSKSESDKSKPPSVETKTPSDALVESLSDF